MVKYLVCYDISKDGSERLSQVSGGNLTVEAENEQEAIEEARATIAKTTGQTILDAWVPSQEPHELSHLYPIQEYGHWGEEK